MHSMQRLCRLPPLNAPVFQAGPLRRLCGLPTAGTQKPTLRWASRSPILGAPPACRLRSAIPQILPQRSLSDRKLNAPLSALEVARPSGVCTMMKLPYQESAEGLDAAFIGVPLDTGTSNRPGARFGPRHIRAESSMARRYNVPTRAAPYDSILVADIGDVNVNLYDLKDSCRLIREAYQKIMATGCIPLTMGGDHTITYPILQAVAEKHGPVGLVHVDAHDDTGDMALGEKIYHGTPFRRCVEEGLLDCKRVVQIGLRGSSYVPDPYDFCIEQGFRVVFAKDCWYKSLAPLMAEVRQQMGYGPVYITFDIDGLDPSFAPGTGTPEIAGLTTAQLFTLVLVADRRRLRGERLAALPRLKETERRAPGGPTQTEGDREESAWRPYPDRRRPRGERLAALPRLEETERRVPGGPTQTEGDREESAWRPYPAWRRPRGECLAALPRPKETERRAPGGPTQTEGDREESAWRPYPDQRRLRRMRLAALPRQKETKKRAPGGPTQTKGDREESAWQPYSGEPPR
ncbi:guanidino acid hydrolase, mitochondrial [Hyperolius riggenbachi]|uniref:guanidino acid hydrolase, mitochondrial n=1 Tax=Hyperolius riggenbachi TaxID=752182 RepID=UPI0035A287A9